MDYVLKYRSFTQTLGDCFCCNGAWILSNSRRLLINALFLSNGLSLVVEHSGTDLGLHSIRQTVPNILHGNGYVTRKKNYSRETPFRLAIDIDQRKWL